ncbi:MAG: valine--tRNA ligase [Alteromonadaceae bacterium]|nr:valine--tRNA ligase [Alteromonadaceae bacterium]
MSDEQNQLPPKYNPQEVEAGRYQFWLDGHFFEAKDDPEKEPYSIVIPPPNVTGRLHLGHAWDTTMQDTITRMKRMQGYDVLWLPGMDHAGIATQAKVEAKLKEKGTSRYELGREKFLETAWEWKEEYADFIRSQWEKLGLGLDYSRERFTLDDGLSDAVREVFVRLYEKGLIYRGEYIINWDPSTQTALSDIEVIYEEIPGKFYHMRYPIKGSDETIEIATTRPETMLGDTAVAVHPDDERYQHLIGKHVLLPLVNRRIPVIADHHADPEKGSGCVKITPAHDFNDYAVGKRNELPMINVMTQDANIRYQAEVFNSDGTENTEIDGTMPGAYAGLTREEARKQIVADMESEGLVEQIEDHVLSVPRGDRSGLIIEPMLTDQWFADAKTLAKPAIEAVEDGRIQFVPKQYDNMYFAWNRDIQDWCISRQRNWGVPIPLFLHKQTGELHPRTVGLIEEAAKRVEQGGIDAWFAI